MLFKDRTAILFLHWSECLVSEEWQMAIWLFKPNALRLIQTGHTLLLIILLLRRVIELLELDVLVDRIAVLLIW